MRYCMQNRISWMRADANWMRALVLVMKRRRHVSFVYWIGSILTRSDQWVFVLYSLIWLILGKFSWSSISDVSLTNIRPALTLPFQADDVCAEDKLFDVLTCSILFTCTPVCFLVTCLVAGHLMILERTSHKLKFSSDHLPCFALVGCACMPICSEWQAHVGM